MYDENYEKRKHLISKFRSEYWESWKKGLWYTIFYVVSTLIGGVLISPIFRFMPEENTVNYLLVLLIVIFIIILPLNGVAIRIFMRLMSPKEKKVSAASCDNANQ